MKTTQLSISHGTHVYYRMRTRTIELTHQSVKRIEELDKKLAFEQYTADKMGDGFNPDEPNARKFCEVIRIGIEDDTAEVTIFYTPDRGVSCCVYYNRDEFM